MDLAERIKTARSRAGLPQRTIAIALGVSCTAITHWENGSRAPTREKLLELATILNVDCREFGLWDENDTWVVLDPAEEQLLGYWRGMSPRARKNLLKVCQKAAELRMKRDIVAAVQQTSEAA